MSASPINPTFAALVWGLIFSFLAVGIAKRRGYFRLPEKHFSSLPTFMHSLGAFLVYILIYVVIAPAFYLLTIVLLKSVNQPINLEIKGWIQFSALTLLFLGLIIYCFCIYPAAKEVIWKGQKPSWKKGLKDFGMGALSWLISYPLVILMSVLTSFLTDWIWQSQEIEQAAVKQLVEVKEFPFLFAGLAFLVVVIVPFIEELLFRGFMQSWLTRKWGRVASLLVTAFIFALVHFAPSQKTGNIEIISALFVLALFLGFIYERQKTLWASYGLHFTFNAITVVGLILMN